MITLTNVSREAVHISLKKAVDIHVNARAVNSRSLIIGRGESIQVDQNGVVDDIMVHDYITSGKLCAEVSVVPVKDSATNATKPARHNRHGLGSELSTAEAVGSKKAEDSV